MGMFVEFRFFKHAGGLGMSVVGLPCAQGEETKTS